MTEWNMTAKLEVMPKDPEIDLDSIKSSLKEAVGEDAEIHSMNDKPIAFGLTSIQVNLLMSDKKGGMEQLQERIDSIEGVGDVKVTDLNRI